jgi:L-asparagine oxygenase
MLNTIILSDDEFEKVVDLTRMLDLDLVLSNNPDLFCQESKRLSSQLPPRVLHILESYKHSVDPGLLIKCPTSIEPNVRTPSTNSEHVGEQTVWAKIQSLFIHVLGEMVAYEAEGGGHLFQDIVPVKTMADQQTSIGSAELEIHTEQAFSDLKPDYVCLACIRGDPNAKTYILPVSAIYENVSADELRLLCEPLWFTGVDLSFKAYTTDFCKGLCRGPLPILTKDDTDQYRLCFDQDLMTGTTEQSDKMIQRIVDIYYEHRLAYCLEPGDILIINNNRAVHGRSPFTPKYDGEDRFLVRCFAMTETRFAQLQNRVIEAKYS